MRKLIAVVASAALLVAMAIPAFAANGWSANFLSYSGNQAGLVKQAGANVATVGVVQGAGNTGSKNFGNTANINQALVQENQNQTNQAALANANAQQVAPGGFFNVNAAGATAANNNETNQANYGINAAVPINVE